MGRPIRAVIMRGGTSKAIILHESDLPADPYERDRLILEIFGSPDKRQIDGLGGADPLTSKLAIIGPARTEEPLAAGTHLTYTFGQVEIDAPEIDWLSLCGNITSAVGAFAVSEKFVQPTSPVTEVRIFNTNLNRVLTVEVPVENGAPVERGSYVVPGVPGTGAKILIDFSATAGGATGRLLPTGNVVDRLQVHDFGKIEASLVDIGNPHVFIRARDVGMRGIESAAEIDRNSDVRALLERIRGAAAERLGMATSAVRARHETPATPILGVVSPPTSYVDELTGKTLDETEMDLVSRLMFMQQTHKTYAGTSTVCTGVASRLPGSIVNEVSRRHNRREVSIGHPAGIIKTETVVDCVGEDYLVRRATLGRTARRLMEGFAFVRDVDASSAP